jgi:hypothetical protein
MPTTHTIYVNATIDDPDPPHLSDDEGHNASTAEDDKNMTTIIEPGDTIIWRKSGDITSLEEITESGGNNLFSSDPAQQEDGSWMGIVGNMDPGTTEEYVISYIVDNGMFYTQDPKLTMKRPSN